MLRVGALPLQVRVADGARAVFVTVAEVAGFDGVGGLWEPRHEVFLNPGYEGDLGSLRLRVERWGRLRRRRCSRESDGGGERKRSNGTDDGANDHVFSPIFLQRRDRVKISDGGRTFS